MAGLTALFLIAFEEADMASTIGRARDNLKLRKGPGLEHETFDIVRAGQKVEILSNQGDWMLVKVDGNEGYVISKFVVPVKESGERGG